MANEVTNFNIGGVDHAVKDEGGRALIAALQQALDALTGGDTTTAIETFQEVIDFLSGVTDDETLIGKLNALNTAINAKYSKPNNGIPVSDLTSAIQTILNSVANKVDKVTGKGLSTNDYTDAEKTKLAGIAAGAQVNVISGIKAHGASSNLPVTNGVVELPESEAGGLTEADIDVSSNQDGAVVFTFGESSYTINLNHTHPQYVVVDELDDYILAGTNVTITKDAQTGALTINASGGSTQVQANWNETDTASAAYIQNKPSIPSKTSDLTNDSGFTSNVGTIIGITMNGSSKGTSGVVDLGTVITSHQDISGKANKSEMSVSASGDQTTIQLKSGTSATVINQHQSLTGRVQSTDVAQIVVLADEAAYTALATKDSNTLYIILES